MTNAFTIDRTKPSFAIEMQKNKTHQKRMTQWVEERRDKGIEPCYIPMKNTPDPIRGKSVRR